MVAPRIDGFLLIALSGIVERAKLRHEVICVLGRIHCEDLGDRQQGAGKLDDGKLLASAL